MMGGRGEGMDSGMMGGRGEGVDSGMMGKGGVLGVNSWIMEMWKRLVS